LNWELPGGIGEVNESPAETAVREVQEETGLRVVARHTTGCYYTSDNDKLHFVFWCDREEPDAVPFPDCDEISECRFFDVESLPRPMSDWTMRRIDDASTGVRFGLPEVIGPRVWVE